MERQTKNPRKDAEVAGMATFVSPHAVVDPAAQLADDVFVGPFCVVGPDVKIGRGTRLESSVTLMGHVTLGEDNHVFPYSVIGAHPQDVSYRNTDTKVVIGDGNMIREGVTINRATEKEDGVTRVGSHNYLMAGAHVAHDCQLGSHIKIANGTMLGGHVHIHDFATLSGAVGVHHFATVGAYSFIGGQSRVIHDVPPYMLVDGQPARPRCVNVVALKRSEFSDDAIRALSEAHRLMYRAKVGLQHVRELLSGGHLLHPAVSQLMNFLEQQQQGRHGRARERRRAA
jgi:UDP-N-acetylglucosamine acyltransferase